MKRNVTIFDRLRIFFKWIKQEEGYGLSGSCDFCKSTKLKRLDSSTKQIDNNTIEYVATYKCMNCNAEAKAKEIWTKSQ